VRELCHGTKTFGDLLKCMPLISRTMLVRRLRELASAGVVRIDPKQKGRGHTYRLTAAGEDFRPLIVLMSEWGQRWGQESIGPDDLDPQLLMWALRGQVDPADIPEQGFVIRFEFRGLPKVHRKLRYWWLLLRPEDIEICVKDYGVRVDLVVDADLGAFTRVWLGYCGLLGQQKWPNRLAWLASVSRRGTPYAAIGQRAGTQAVPAVTSSVGRNGSAQNNPMKIWSGVRLYLL
jgi:DNA-binding HxlR family transcriptional regulator